MEKKNTHTQIDNWEKKEKKKDFIIISVKRKKTDKQKKPHFFTC